ncbi:MAG: diguanylate cyclase, partial [Dehalococcoidia bacterium]|nr:diguanylate cyclase [Dehalococcoidia bacterium]
MTGYSTEALKAKSYLDLIHPLYRDGVAARLRQGLQGNETPGRYEIYLVARDGSEMPVEATGSPVIYMGRPAVVGYLRNITDRKQAETSLREMATRDYLTGLWNHREFQARLLVEIARAQRGGEHFSLLFMDVDHFKKVNDRFGHLTGDRILQTIGKFLKDALRTSDIACRYGGDEFAVILPNTDVQHCGPLVSRVLEAGEEIRSKDMLLRGLAPQLGLSIGVAGYPEDSTEAQELVRKANQAMFYAKSLGGNRSQVWGDAMKEFEAEPDKLRELLRQANLDTALALAGAIDARDAHTLGHSKRVSELAAAVARKLGLNEADAEGIRISGLLHDLGKIGLPDALLHKRHPLTAEESLIMKRHVELGVKMLSGLDYMRDKLEIVRGHHENWDGSGYPDGISGERISLGARIIRAVDTFDAMVTDRPYRTHISQGEALEEIESLDGKTFDPAVVSALKVVVTQR